MTSTTQPRPSQSDQSGGGVVRTIRYEETAIGKAPIPITPNMQRSTRAPPASVPEQSLAQRPMTAPAVRQSPRVSQFSEDIKRDSAIASSPKSPASTKYSASIRPGTNGVSSIQEEEQRSPRRPSFTARRSKKNVKQQKPRSVSPPQIKRLSSFKGLQTDIPTGGLEDLDADKFGFSHRGSIFFGGQKMDHLFGSAIAEETASAPRPEPAQSIDKREIAAEQALRSVTQTSPVPMIPTIIEPESAPLEPVQAPREVPPVDTTNVQHGDAAAPGTPSPTGLVSGRRKPSVQMLQAAIAGGRVLSAEEITFSMKVRSMYEAGDESGADWSAPSIATSTGKATPDTTTTKESDLGAVAEATPKSPREGAVSRASRLSQDIRASYHTKSDHELAGGIEDWQDLEGTDVDRYGFIVPKKPGERPTSSIAADIAPGEGLHRVATGLRLAADQPRRRGLRRTPSTARSSRSVPPQASIRPSSLHSGASAATSTKSRRSAFRGRQRRLMDSAGDMLTLPPGLADIAEQQDEGQALAQLRRREWSRNEKWQKMARPLQDSVKGSGGGMHFDFDTDDPKLISRTWKGIPDRWRATAWHSFLSASARRRGNYESDASLMQQFRQLQEVNCADDYQIDVDVPRTISMHVMFRRRYRGGQRLLFRVLHAIALYLPETSYVQGMASLAATLLCYFDEERAFVMMVRLWQLRGLEQLFQPGFAGLMTALKELEEQWLAGSDVASKLNELSIASTSYGTRWYLTLFNMSIPFPAQLRVWDVFMLLGDASPRGSGAFAGADLDVLHATSSALIDATREIIMDSDFENAMKVLTSFVPIRDEDLLMRVARAEWKMGKKRSGND